MQYSNIDLHCHSLASDGDLRPAMVVERAAANGVTLLALTDHDTIAGQAEAMQSARELGVAMVSGIELSCLWRGYTIHVLGYHFSLTDGLMAQVQQAQTMVRIKRAKQINQVLLKKGLPDLLDTVSSFSKSGVPGRPHFAQAMVELGVVKNHGEAFKKYLGSGKPGDISSGWPELSQIVQWIRAAGGCAVIAHPRKYKMSLTSLRDLIAEFKACGGEGLEVVVSGQKQGEIGLMSDLCQRFQLKASVGSDFHTPKFPWADLGRVPPLPKSLDPVWADWLRF